MPGTGDGVNRLTTDDLAHHHYVQPMETGKNAANAYRKVQGLIKQTKEGAAARSQVPPSAGSPPSRPSSTNPTGDTPTQLRQVATFLALIGREEAAQVLQRMDSKDAERVLAVMADLPPIPADEARRVLARFGAQAQTFSRQTLPGPETAREILIRAFGMEEGDRQFYRILPDQRPRPFAFLEDVDGRQLSALLRKESIPVISILVACMPSKAAARLLDALAPEAKVQVIRRVSMMNPVMPEVIHQIEHSLREKIERLGTPEEEIEVDGHARLADILRYMSLSEGEQIISSLEDGDPDLAEQIRANLTTPDDLQYISDRDLQRVLQRVDDLDIATMLKGKRPVVVERITTNISERRREMVEMHREALGPMRRSDVDKITSDFMHLVRTMAQNGEIVIRLPGEKFVNNPPPD